MTRHFDIDRRVAGALVLVVAFVSLVLISKSLGAGLLGIANPLPLPPPPSVGSCLAEQGTARVEVDCAAPHTAQIVLSWPVWKTVAATTFVADLKQRCWTAGSLVLLPLGLSRADPYSGSIPGTEWGPVPLVIDTDVVMGAAAPDAASWVACVLRPRSAVTPGINDPIGAATFYSNSIEELIPMSVRPLSLRSCYESQELLPTTVGCSALHRGEVLAVKLDLDPSTTADVVELDRAACTQLAEELLKTQDPTFGGRTRTAVVSHPADTQITGQAGQGLTGHLKRCVVEPIDGLFFDSVIGIGTRPLPMR